MAVGDDWMLAGNAGTVDGTDYIGTSDNVALNFRVNAQKSGRIDGTTGETFFGYQAGMGTAGGEDNSAFGSAALTTNSTGLENSAFGSRALHWNNGGSNSAFGNSSLYQNTTGYGNTAMGYNSLLNNTIGGNNVSLGGDTLYTNTTGSSNVAVGPSALNVNLSGSNNIAIGPAALNGNNVGNNNIGLGVGTGLFNTNGQYNIYVGYKSGVGVKSGNSNIFLGSYAGYVSVVTSNKLQIETNAAYAATPLINGDFLTRRVQISGSLASSTGSATGTDAVALGNNSTATTFSSMAIGQSANSTGQRSVALGANNGATNANGHFSFAVGHNATSNAGTQHAHAFGTNGVAAHNFSTIISQSPSSTVQTSAPNRITIKADGGVEICTAASPMCSPGSTTQYLGGAGWSYPSDKNLKEDFQTVDENYVMERLTDLDITSWVYKNEKNKNGSRRIGPMAQDFYRIFAKPMKLESTDKMLTPNELYNLGIIATQGLLKRTKELEKENVELKNKINSLEDRMNSFELRMKKLEAKPDKNK
jgi:hypothetical protein